MIDFGFVKVRFQVVLRDEQRVELEIQHVVGDADQPIGLVSFHSRQREVIAHFQPQG